MRTLFDTLGAATRILVAFFVLHTGPALAQVPAAAEVVTGTEIISSATSDDGRWTLMASRHPDALTLLDARRQPVRSFPLTTLDGHTRSRVAQVHDTGPRQSFVVALQDIAELWEISYNPQAEPIFDGLVHDYRMGEALATPGFLGVRRTPLDAPLHAFLLDPSGRIVIGVTPPNGSIPPTAQVIHLDVRRRIASFALPGSPDMASAVQITRGGTALLGIPLQGSGCVTVVNMKTWQVLPSATAPGRCVSVPEWIRAAGTTAPRSAPDAGRQ